MPYRCEFELKFYNILYFLSEGMLNKLFIILDVSKNCFQGLAKNPIH